MLGTIAGDIIGSPYEFTLQNIKTTNFPFFNERSKFTDDTVMTIAIANAVMEMQNDLDRAEEYFINSMVHFGRLFPWASYGKRFIKWICSSEHKPYNSCGNGSAMRVSPVAWAFDSLEEVEKYARLSSIVSHNHPEGIKGACATASAIFLARTGKSQKEISDYITNNYGYNLANSLEEIRENTVRSELAEKSVPVAITAFLHSASFEDAIRKAVSLGGDSDTIAAICGGITEAYFGGVPQDIWQECELRLAPPLLEVIAKWNLWLADKA